MAGEFLAATAEQPPEDAGIETGVVLTPSRDLLAQQAALELDMAQAGRLRHERASEQARRAGRASDTSSGVATVDARTLALEAAITAFLEAAQSGARGRPPRAARYLREIAPRQTAFLTLRVLINLLVKPVTVTRAAMTIASAVEDEARFQAFRRHDLEAYDRLLEVSKRRRGQRDRRKLFLRGVEMAGLAWEDWPAADKELIGAQLIGMVIERLGLVEIVDGGAGRKSSKKLQLTEAAARWMSRVDEAAALLRPPYEPMVIPPTPWRGPYGGGYLTCSARPLRLVKTSRRAYLDDLAAQDMPIVYRALNAAQATPWRINRPVLRVMEQLAGDDAAIAGLPRQTPAPAPAPEAEDGDAPGRRRAWRAAERERRSKLAAFVMTLGSARRFQRFDKIYFPMSLDFRGRLYAAPRLNPQGPDLMRGLLQFARGKPLGAEGGRWLAIHLCNLGDFMKMSKAPLAHRVEWTRENENRILTVAADPLADLWWTEADKPWQFLAACLEWAGYVEGGERHLSRLPVALDGSCSGIQHFSLALRDPVGGAAVNLAPSARSNDIYQQVADAVTQLLREDLGSSERLRCGRGEDGAPRETPVAELARQWLAFGVTRAVCKRPTMTYGYGARGYGYADQIMDDTLRPALEAHRREAAPWPFEGNGASASIYLAARVTEAVERVVLKAAEAMRWLQDAASLAAAEGVPVRWTTPDGFPALQAYPDTAERRVRTTIAGQSLSLKIREAQPSFDRRLQRQGIAPNFVHSLDACHLRLTVTRAHQEGMRDFALIHDSFGVHAADTARFFQIIRETMVEMYGAIDVVEEFRTELSGQLSARGRERLGPAPEKGALPLEAVLQSEFCFA